MPDPRALDPSAGFWPGPRGFQCGYDATRLTPEGPNFRCPVCGTEYGTLAVALHEDNDVRLWPEDNPGGLLLEA